MVTHHTEEYDDDLGADCTQCGRVVPYRRLALGYTLCLSCGERAARSARASWCVVQAYGKGPYQFVTNEAAPRVLLDTNQKYPRS